MGLQWLRETRGGGQGVWVTPAAGGMVKDNPDRTLNYALCPSEGAEVVKELQRHRTTAQTAA